METPEQTELRRLEDTYDLLNESRREPGVTTWLGRHRSLGRDVTISVYRVGPGMSQDELAHLATDARLLSGVRREGVVPVVESRWLSHEAFAIVRARVRGTTLRELIEKSGPLPPARVADALRDIGTSLEWARRQGLVHRTLTPDTVCIQQGSGRLLLSFAAAPTTPADTTARPLAHAAHRDPTEALLDRCSDARTLGMLGWEMLTGRAMEGTLPSTGVVSLRERRPDVSPELAEVIEQGLTCDRADAPELPALLERLSAPRASASVRTDEPRRQARGGAGAATAGSARMPGLDPAMHGSMADVTTPASQAGPSTPSPDVRPAPVMTTSPDAPRSAPWIPAPAAAWTPPPAHTPEPARERPRRRQLATAGVGLAVLGLATMLFVSSGRDDDERDSGRAEPARRTAPAAVGRPDTAHAAGEVVAGGEELTTPRPEGMAGSRSSTRPATPPASPPAVLPPAGGQVFIPAPRVSERPEAARAPRTPPAAMTARPTGAQGLAACSSPAMSDQRTCLDAHLALSDVELNRAYLELISVMRQRAGAAPGEDPPAVRQLRAEQRAWLGSRDAQCRGAGVARDGEIWAPARASCLGQVSVRRANQLWERVRQGG